MRAVCLGAGPDAAVPPATRSYFGAHWIGDILAGMAIGTVITVCVFREVSPSDVENLLGRTSVLVPPE